MYPQSDLKVLALRKLRLVQRIRRRREECGARAQQVLKPAAWAEGAYARWKAVSPLSRLAAVPVGLWVTKRFFPGATVWLRWVPVALNLFRAFRR